MSVVAVGLIATVTWMLLHLGGLEPSGLSGSRSFI